MNFIKNLKNLLLFVGTVGSCSTALSTQVSLYPIGSPTGTPNSPTGKPRAVLAESVATLKNKLNSERIEYFFGNYGIEKTASCQELFPDAKVSVLYSWDKEKIKHWKTLAIVLFQPVKDPRIFKTDRKIKQGASLGATLKENGYLIRKEPVYIGEAGPEKNSYLVYEMKIKHRIKNSSWISYCKIIEIYSKDYLNQEWLNALYPEKTNQAKLSENTSSLKKLIETCFQNFVTGNDLL